MQVTTTEAWKLDKLLSLENTRIGKGQGLDAAVMRKHGQVMVMAIPPFLAEVQDNNHDIMRLVFTFYHLELNSYGVIKWPPGSIYSTDSQYSAMEVAAYQTCYRMWDDERVSMIDRFGSLVERARRAGLADSEEEEAVEEPNHALTDSGDEWE